MLKINPLVQELQQGRKICSLDALMAKLDEDQRRHIIHKHSVLQGLSRVLNAQTSPNASAGGQRSSTAGDPTTGSLLLGEGALLFEEDRQVSTEPCTPFAAAGPGGLSRVEAFRQEVYPALSPIVSKVPPAPPAPANLQISVHSASPDKLAMAALPPIAASQGAQPSEDRKSPDRLHQSEPRSSDLAQVEIIQKGFKVTLDLRLATADVKRPTVQIKESSASEHQEIAAFSHSDDVLALAISPDGSTIVGGGEDSALTVWDVPSSTQKKQISVEGVIKTVAFCPNGEYFSGAGEDSFIGLWSKSTFEEVAFYSSEFSVLCIVFSPHSDILAIGGTDSRVTLVTVPGMVEVVDLIHVAEVRSLSFSPDGTILAGGGGSGRIVQQAQDDDQKIIMWTPSVDPDECNRIGSICLDETVNSVAFSPDNKYFACGSEGGRVSILNVEKQFPLEMELPCVAGVTCLSWSANSQYLLSGGQDMKCTVWDISNCQMLSSVPKRMDWLCDVAFDPNMRFFASCCFGEARITLRALNLRSDGSRCIVEATTNALNS
eukprot:gnl/MRDRNA2_/MRDRNA2_117479_c0_seq1.p1 gnl/MRDRNA2_/MRDRNA2_117479_c0~~gnl/MRDRNA2_/MRDRNA2_117479_c0_seq1.p1  ORF type:complete len:546 (+),score=101.82 gnl/MRDRNA2_/MRDRNA2_117479_c0_seq1:61-1698(+)